MVDPNLQFQSPFKLPTDQQVFLTRQVQRLQKLQHRQQVRDQRIWQKQTASTNRRLVRPRDSDFNLPPINSNSYSFIKPKEKNLVSAAMDIVNQRARTASQQNQNIRSYVEQKKEIFRVQMKNRILRSERMKVRERIQKKEMALKMSEDYLDADHRRFNDHMQRNKILKEQAVALANSETLAKKEKESQIKHLQQKKASILAEINRNDEYLKSLIEHQEFLNSRTPNQWLRKQKEKYEEAYSALKADWISKQAKQEFFESQADNDSSLSFENRPKRSALQNESILQHRFDQLLRQGVIELSVQTELFFTEPDQLTADLKELEDKNLFLIQQLQEKDQELEIEKASFSAVNSQYQSKCEQLRRHKEQLSGQLKQMEAKLNALNRRKSQIEQKKQTSRSESSLREDIQQFFKDINKQEDSAYKPIEILEYLEGYINDLLGTLKQLRKGHKDIIEELEGKYENIRRQAVRDKNTEQEMLEMQNRIRIAQERAQGSSKKMQGIFSIQRPNMFRVNDKKERKKKVVTKAPKTIEEEIEEFIDRTAAE